MEALLTCDMTINEVREIVANQMKEILKDAKIEPRHIPLLGETLYPRSAIHTDEACIDIWAYGYWT